ncbi:MAG: tRNA (N6-threonylcarbamoyladenosine(37)-N6)-methyltransferase TrmO [Lachnospiraceae bacterium]|nr:tRNA (N6-threonylcarbamoyladenosine(37)-N6)-methyltransferase TrmO [Ruminococcus sp.]MCM1275745.1 tRNA (N6-threonylcarbamoyladenosine(37)-N6)-methyltransferase TrmO [Lachnospiraceae bacterium]
MVPIAFIKNDYKEKFGIPRQSGLVSLRSQIVLEPNFRDENALRGVEDFTHIWLIWGFSAAQTDGFSPTVRPPRLGGNVRKGVFATRSPFRPNSLGLSAVRLVSVSGFTLTVEGADLMSGTPIYDIKPYLPYADSLPGASNGWALSERGGLLSVEFPEELLEKIPSEKRRGLLETLAQDPRPQYQSAPERLYTMAFGEFQVSFKIMNNALTVTDVRK